MNPTLFPPNSSLFLGDLSKFCSETDLEKLFGQFGEINQIRIMRNTNTGKALSYGFISFINNECAALAMENLNGYSLHGRSMRIGWAAHNLKTHKTEEPAIINSVYVRFITPQTAEYVTEEVIHRAFDQFGSVVDVSIKQSAVDQRSGRQSGYGFVHFSADHAGIIAAFDALSKMNNNTHDGVTYSVEPSKNLLRQMNELNLGMGNGQVAALATPPLPAPAQQQSAYSKSVPVQGRVEAPQRPRPSRDDQLARLYVHAQMQPSSQPTPMTYSRPPSAAQSHTGHMHGQYGSNNNNNNNAISPRYANPASGYGAPPPAQYESGTYRYGPQNGVPPRTNNSNNTNNNHMNGQYQDHGGAYPGMHAYAGHGASEDSYSRPQAYSAQQQHQVQAPGQYSSQQAHLSVRSGSGHTRTASAEDFDFNPAAEEFTSSYVIEKPIYDEPSSYEIATPEDLRPPALNLVGNRAPMLYSAAGGLPTGLPTGMENRNGPRSPYSYGPNGSPHNFGEKSHITAGGLPAKATQPQGQYDHRQQQQLQLAAPSANNEFASRRVNAVPLSSNSHSFYSHLPGGGNSVGNGLQSTNTRSAYAPRRPPGVTDLDTNVCRSHSMSSSGLPTYSTSGSNTTGTTDSEGGFFKSANSSFTEGHYADGSHQYAGNSNWTGINQQSLMSHNGGLPSEQEALSAEARTHRLLTASMRKLSMASVTTCGDEAVDDFVEDEEDDFTFGAPSNTSTSDSLFNYSEASASFHKNVAAPSSYLTAPTNTHSSNGAAALHMAHHPLNSFTSQFDPRDGGPHQQQHSEVDDSLYQAKQPPSLSGPAGSFYNRNNIEEAVFAEKTASDFSQKQPKSRQLAVTHFFKPVGSA